VSDIQSFNYLTGIGKIMFQVFEALDTAGIIALLVGTVLPLITALLVKSDWNRDAKGVALLALSGLTAVLAQWGQALTSDVPFDWRAVVLSAIGTFLVALATHYGIWKDSPTQEKLLAKGNT
jgi:predicted membrane channel-forming protein YqfA (hemolysin III family)